MAGRLTEHEEEAGETVVELLVAATAWEVVAGLDFVESCWDCEDRKEIALTQEDDKIDHLGSFAVESVAVDHRDRNFLKI